MSGSDQQDLAFKGQQFPFSLSGRSEVLCGKVEEGESQHTEEILTFYRGRGMLGRGRCAQRGEEVGEGRMLGAASRSIWPELSFASVLSVYVGRWGRRRGPRASPAWSLPCCYSAQKHCNFCSAVPECCPQGMGIRGPGLHAIGHRTRGSGIPDGEISGLVTQSSPFRLWPSPP